MDAPAATHFLRARSGSGSADAERGTTLLEIVVASALVGVITVIGIGLVRSTLDAMNDGVEHSTQQARARAALAILCQELRQSGRNDPDDPNDSQLALTSALPAPRDASGAELGPPALDWVSFRRVIGSDARGDPLWSDTAHFLVTLEPTEGAVPNGRDDDGDGMIDELWLQRLDSASGQRVTLLTDVRSLRFALVDGGARLEIALEVYARERDGRVTTLSWQTSVSLRNR